MTNEQQSRQQQTERVAENGKATELPLAIPGAAAQALYLQFVEYIEDCIRRAFT